MKDNTIVVNLKRERETFDLLADAFFSRISLDYLVEKTRTDMSRFINN